MRDIGLLERVTIAVEDVEAGRDFWSAVTGLAVTAQDVQAGWVDLEPAQVAPAGPVVSLRRATVPKAPTSANRGHVDITVTDIDLAISQVQELGGVLKVGPAVYPRPLSDADGAPEIDWAVTTDPFGNEFCLIRDLEDVEKRALVDSSAWGMPAKDSTWNQQRLSNRYDDALWRQIAQEARFPDGPQKAEPAVGAALPVGKLRCCVINVDDLAVALQFWSVLIGAKPMVSEWPFRFAYIGREDERAVGDVWGHQMILQRTIDTTRDDADRVHYDIAVDDLEEAVSEVRWMLGIPGATTSEALLLVMHAYDDAPRRVMRDRSGNSFCLVERR